MRQDDPGFWDRIRQWERSGLLRRRGYNLASPYERPRRVPDCTLAGHEWWQPEGCFTALICRRCGIPRTLARKMDPP